MHKWIVDTVNSVLRTVIAAAVISVLIGLWAYLDNLPGSVIAVIVLFAIGGVLLVFTQLRKLHPFKGGKTVAGRTLENSQVTLDGNSFTDCTFRNVTFKWDGGPGTIVRGRVEGSKRFETDNGLIADTVDILKALNFLEPQFAASWKRRDDPRVPVS